MIPIYIFIIIYDFLRRKVSDYDETFLPSGVFIQKISHFCLKQSYYLVQIDIKRNLFNVSE